ncbi:MAG: ATP-grasp domain-containing protein [Bacteroidetes bacterium]|nr:ATP-grasp domain-containing protein [Bacteroidota bacterium]
MKRIRVLMTGAGAPGGPGIIKCLQADKRIDLTVCDANASASGRFLNKEFFQCPPASDSGFSEFMLQKSRDLEVDVLFPLVTRELFLFAERKNEFAATGTKVIVSDKDALNTANNKSRLHQHLKSSGIMVPEFYVANTLEELENAFSSLGYPQKKVCIKPSVSNGSRGVRIIDPMAKEFDLLFNEKPNSLYMLKDDLFRILKGHKFPELLVSEVLPGEEFTIDTLMYQGKSLLIVPRSRTKMNAGISVAGEIVKQEEIIAYVQQMSATLPLHGPIGFQVKKADDGKFKLLEINPRIQGTSVSLMGAGVNLPLLAVLQEAGEEVQIPEVKWGTKFVRFYNEVYYR